jgi:mRNA interferase HigB
MQIINEKVIALFSVKHADSDWLANWVTVARAANWRTIQEVKATFPAVDGGVKVKSGGTVTVFDVCGNRYRMIVSVIYQVQVLIILELMTHADYSKNRWKMRY